MNRELLFKAIRALEVAERAPRRPDLSAQYKVLKELSGQYVEGSK